MYRYELHMHTKEGSLCSPSTVGEMIRRFKELDFSGAAVTNHFFGGNTCIDRTLPWCDFVNGYSRAYFEGQNEAARLDFDLLFGIEEGYGNGKEILVYGIEPQFLIDRPHLRRAPVEVWSREVHSAGGFIAYAHPFRNRPYIKEPRAIPDLSLVDGLEVYNYCNTYEDNADAVRAFSDSGKALIAGSDLHRDDFTGAYGVYLQKRVHTSAELAEQLLAHNFRVAVPENER